MSKGSLGQSASDVRTETHPSPERWTVIGDDSGNLHVVIDGRPHLRICFMTSDGPTEKRAAHRVGAGSTGGVHGRRRVARRLGKRRALYRCDSRRYRQGNG